MSTPDFEKLGAFYLGRLYDPVNRKARDELLLYDSKDLVTHAVCVGMTGSGKTGLCVALLEEAAIDGVPAIVIDPKGDLADLLLQFPDLRGEDFAPWVSEDEARQLNIPAAEYAARQAAMWREGLARWGEDGARIRRLQESADFAIYTPASGAGLPLSILKSFDAPPAAIRQDRELLRDRISGAATALLSLLGVQAEPMKSREHILLSTIFDHAWNQGQGLDLPGLIQLIQTPPVTRIGVVDLETFYPARERFELAMSLNNLLASPGFEAWLEGEPLDIARLLHTPAGKPRISILSIAHLGDAERMFFVSLLLNEVLSWTRLQSGTTSLRALVYMDEIFGYFPPIANPPSKRPLLTLLKQARAFGVGIVLSTQNPVDLDYKGLANAGTWFIGRLQTERDKERLLEGLESAAGETGGRFDRQRIEQILSGLGKRIFLMNNVHDEGPAVFESRWALSYLPGPLTRAQIRMLMEPRKHAVTAAAAPPAALPGAHPAGAAAAPAGRVSLPPEVPQAYIPARAQDAILYEPVLLAAVQVRFVDTRAKIDTVRNPVFITAIKDDSLPVQWEEAVEIQIDPSALEQQPQEGAAFAGLPGAAARPKSYASWNKDLVNWINAHQALELFRSPSLKVASEPGESEGEFRVRLQQIGREQRDRAVDKVRRKYAPKLASLEEKRRRAQQALEREQEQAGQQTFQAAVSVGGAVLGALFGRKLVSRANVGSAASAARSMGRSRKESGDVERARETVEVVRGQLENLEAEVRLQTDQIQAAMDPATEPLERIIVKPKKTNIAVRLFTLAWAPYRKNAAGALEPAW